MILFYGKCYIVGSLGLGDPDGKAYVMICAAGVWRASLGLNRLKNRANVVVELSTEAATEH